MAPAVRFTLPSLAALLAAVLAAAPARAAEEELVLAIEPGYGFLAGDAAKHGVGGTASLWLGITEALWLSGSAGAFHFFHDTDDTNLVEAYGGLVAALDVLRTIPFFEAHLGVVIGRDGQLSPGVRFGIGADYLVSPTFSIGGVVRYRTLTEEIGSDSLLTAAVRIGFRFEL